MTENTQLCYILSNHSAFQLFCNPERKTIIPHISRNLKAQNFVSMSEILSWNKKWRKLRGQPCYVMGRESLALCVQGQETQFPSLLLPRLTGEFLAYLNSCFILSRTTKLDTNFSQCPASFNTLSLNSPWVWGAGSRVQHRISMSTQVRVECISSFSFSPTHKRSPLQDREKISPFLSLPGKHIFPSEKKRTMLFVI